MGGLLYKDFVSVSGKKIVWAISCLTIAFIALRIVFPGTMEIASLMAEGEDGRRINLLDVFFVTGLGLFLLFITGLLNGWAGKIVEGDDKNKIRAYISALPLNKNTYIASKYIFIGISAYVFLSVAYIWQISANAFCGEGMIEDLIYMISLFIPALTSIALLTAAIELPLFLIFGKGKAMLIKITIMILLGFIVIGFLFFGNLAWFEVNFNIGTFMKWYKKHTFEVALFNLISPVIVLVLYYFSYCISCHFTGKKAAYYE